VYVCADRIVDTKFLLSKHDLLQPLFVSTALEDAFQRVAQPPFVSPGIGTISLLQK
jgi:hypothetical protein